MSVGCKMKRNKLMIKSWWVFSLKKAHNSVSFLHTFSDLMLHSHLRASLFSRCGDFIINISISMCIYKYMYVYIYCDVLMCIGKDFLFFIVLGSKIKD